MEVNLNSVELPDHLLNSFVLNVGICLVIWSFVLFPTPFGHGSATVCSSGPKTKGKGNHKEALIKIYYQTLIKHLMKEHVKMSDPTKFKNSELKACEMTDT